MPDVAVIHAYDNALDVVVECGGKRFCVKYVGIGHPIHMIEDGAGRVATRAEVALAKAIVKVVDEDG